MNNQKTCLNCKEKEQRTLSRFCSGKCKKEYFKTSNDLLFERGNEYD